MPQWGSAFRARFASAPLPTARSDTWHHQTVQPDPGAQSYAYDHLLLPFYPVYGNGAWWNERSDGGLNPFSNAPFILQSAQVQGFPFAGQVQGSPDLTALLVSHFDALKEGLARRGTASA